MWTPSLPSKKYCKKEKEEEQNNNKKGEKGKEFRIKQKKNAKNKEGIWNFAITMLLVDDGGVVLELLDGCSSSIYKNGIEILLYFFFVFSK